MLDDDDGIVVADEEFESVKEPKSARPWLAMIAHSEREFRDYQQRADNIDKLYASLERLANATRDRQFQMFWANIQVLSPAVYARPPVPVVVPRFQDTRPVPRTASELLERSATVAIEMEDIDAVMRHVRDDLIVLARGCAWVRYETKTDSDTKSERVCIEHVDRHDFLHEAARTWKEVDWVAKRSWLNKRAMRKRFKSTSGDVYKDASYAIRKDPNDNHDGTEKAGVWEIWSRSGNNGKGRVVWVSEGCDKLLDDDKPHLELSGFFPCPRPAYSTVQRGSLIPVPDMVFYKDQLEEINELTARISALTEGVKLRGFYPAGSGELSAAIEAAITQQSNNVVLQGIANFQLLGNGTIKDMILWLPIDMIVKAISELVALRKNLIDDVYQITGLSDIMRGDTVASETLGAQQLKSQYGSIRIRDRQDELVRLARDICRITAEIMAENFDGDTLLEMAQLEMPTDAEIMKQVKPLEKQRADMAVELKKAENDPQLRQMAAQDPQKAQQVVQQVMQEAQQHDEALAGQIEGLKQTVTIDAVMKLLRDQRLRPFTLDIETDSTITPDENAQKQRVTEYITAMGGLLAQVLPAVQAFPQAAPLFAGIIKFGQKQYRVGREMDQTVDEFANAMREMGAQPKPPDPAIAQNELEAKRLEGEMQLKQGELQNSGLLAQARMIEAQAKQAEVQINGGRLQLEGQKTQLGAQAKQAELGLKQADLQVKSQTAASNPQAEAAQAAIDVANANAQRQRDDEAHQQELMTGALKQEQIRAQTEQARAKAAGEMAKATTTVIPIPLGQT